MTDNNLSDREPGAQAYRYVPARTSDPIIFVVRAVADAANVSPTSLEPLGTCIEPSLLRYLLDPPDGHSILDGSVTFSIDEHEVTVQSDGKVTVRGRS